MTFIIMKICKKKINLKKNSKAKFSIIHKLPQLLYRILFSVSLIQILFPSGNSWKSDAEDEINKEKTPFLASESNPTTPLSKEIPKYIEVLYEASPPEENDGYEVPKIQYKSTDQFVIRDTEKNNHFEKTILECLKHQKVKTKSTNQ